MTLGFGPDVIAFLSAAEMLATTSIMHSHPLEVPAGHTGSSREAWPMICRDQSLWGHLSRSMRKPYVVRSDRAVTGIYFIKVVRWLGERCKLQTELQNLPRKRCRRVVDAFNAAEASCPLSPRKRPRMASGCGPAILRPPWCSLLLCAEAFC
jgi:hypothetical protein